MTSQKNQRENSMSLQRILLLSVLTIVITLFMITGFDVFLPSHENSLDIKGEQVSIRMLTASQVREQYEDDWRVVFAPLQLPTTKTVGAPPGTLVATLGVVATQAALGYTMKLAEREAKSYESQFVGTIIVDDFWVREDSSSPWQPRYYGFEIVRETERFSDQTPAFKLVFGLAPQRDRRQFLAAPLLLKIRSSKSKILHSRWYSYLIPPFVWPVFLDSNDEVRQTAQITLTASWLSDESQKLITLADTQFQLPNVSIASDGDALRVKKQDGYRQLPIGAVISFPGVPRSEGVDSDKSVYASGELRVNAIISQADSSNTKRVVELVRKRVLQSEKDINSAVGSWVRDLVDEVGDGERGVK